MKGSMSVKAMQVTVNGRTVVNVKDRAVDWGCLPLSELSARQLDVLRFIKRFIADNEMPPTIREIGGTCGISSTSDVNHNLRKLVDAGYITRRKNITRGIRLTDAGKAIPGEGRTHA